jgi:molybdopterin converting factor subunit 1
MAKLLYFAWVRQKIGKAEDEIALPAGVTDVTGLIAYLIARGENYASAFSNLQSIRCAVNQEHKGFDTRITDGDEIAFFPPVTGG